MPTEEFKVTVDDNGIAHALEVLGKRGLVKAERAGISKHVKLVRTVARGQADFNQGSIVGRTVMKRGQPTGTVKISDFRLRFYASGVANRGRTPRTTRSGANRGIEFGEPFMERTAALTDRKAEHTINESINDAVRAAGLS